MAPSFCHALTLFTILITLPLGARTWTDVTGRTVEAEYVRHDERELVIQLPTGKTASVPLSKLSKDDRFYLEVLAAQEPEKEKAPAPDSEPANDAPGELEGPTNWDAPWPEEVAVDADPEITVITEDEEAKRFVYESEHYQFTSDIKIAASSIRKFAEVCESTRACVHSLPLSLSDTPRKADKYTVRLVELEKDYLALGAVQGSKGVCKKDRNENYIMVCLEYLGERGSGDAFKLDRDKGLSIFMHEVTHLHTPEALVHGAGAWLSDGIAEYIATLPYRNGRFNFRGITREIGDFVERKPGNGLEGRGLGDSIELGSLEDFISMNYQEFAAQWDLNYGTALLLACYFFHLDGDGDGRRLKEYTKEVRSGYRGDYSMAPEAKARPKLLDGRSWKELEAEISKAWSRHGIDLKFVY